MKKRRVWKIGVFLFVLAMALCGLFFYMKQQKDNGFPLGEPKEVRELRDREINTDAEEWQEYYFGLLTEEEQRGYREILEGVRKRKAEFYLTIYEDEMVNKVYHAVLMDHPELFWVHNRKKIYKTTFSNQTYCKFSPGYSYSEEEIEEIQKVIQLSCEEVSRLLPEGADAYEKAKTVYSYLIDLAEYGESEHDQSIAGIFGEKKAVCAGYAGAAQYLLEYLGVPCIYVEGKTADGLEGHAWNLIELDGSYYYFDVTNGDQPEFLEGDAVQLAEHKTILYDYLCPFPEEYEKLYQVSQEFALPECTATDKNFYVLNQGCFAVYDYEELQAYCRMRLDNHAAVVRFKFSSQEEFEKMKTDWIQGDAAQEVAHYYMKLYGMDHVEYHYGILEQLKTIYYIF